MKMTVVPSPAHLQALRDRAMAIWQCWGGVRAERTLGKEHPISPWGRRVKVSVQPRGMGPPQRRLQAVWPAARPPQPPVTRVSSKLLHGSQEHHTAEATSRWLPR